MFLFWATASAVAGYTYHLTGDTLLSLGEFLLLMVTVYQYNLATLLSFAHMLTKRLNRVREEYMSSLTQPSQVASSTTPPETTKP